MAAVRATPAPSLSRPRAVRSHVLDLLSRSFTCFNAVRMPACLPTVWAIPPSGDSSRHALRTWLTWRGAGSTMAAWWYEHNDRQFNRAAIVNLGHAAMCLPTVLVIAVHRV